MLEPGDNVLCTVERIEGTVVFVKIIFEGREIDGSVITAEIAPGRIRNLRDYVVPKKKIVCKVLRILGNNIELSLRRVTLKERKEVMDKYKQELVYFNIFKKIIGEESDEIIKEMTKDESLHDFVLDSKENPKKLEDLVGKGDAKKILDILTFEKQKKAFVKKEIILKTILPNGIELIKDVLGNVKNDVRYISAGKYSLTAEAENPKKADGILREILSEIEKKAKHKGLDFSIIEK